MLLSITIYMAATKCLNLLHDYRHRHHEASDAAEVKPLPKPPTALPKSKFTGLATADGASWNW